MSAAERVFHFWSRIKRTDGCWLWQGGCTKDGYGQVTLGRRPDGRQLNDYAHRIVYRLTFGPIPDGLVVRHRCDNPPCCNPDHLLLGTQGDNNRDAFARGRQRPDRPGAWHVEPELRRALIAEALDAPRGTIKRLAREHGLNFPQLYMAVKRARLTRAA